MRDLVVKILVSIGLYKPIVELINKAKFEIQARRMRKDGLNMLKAADDVFTKMGVRAFLTYGALLGADAINVGKPGQMIVQGSADVAGRGRTPNVVQTALERQEQEDTVERIKNNYSLLWTPKHKPQGYDNPLIKEAYDRWLAENGYIPGDK